ncbi:hypothetical protein [Streptomyces sp. NPDC093111]|uniref:hypothetical protein n=1 Tax=Streptomyces sp. NPDC093111 TaxID=3154978 RepID=UPI003419DF6E
MSADTDHLHPALATIRECDMGEYRSTPGETNRLPEHALNVFSVDGTELVDLTCAGAMPVPAVGDVIGLHEAEARVVSVSTRYTRSNGRVNVYTHVVVEADEP